MNGSDVRTPPNGRQAMGHVFGGPRGAAIAIGPMLSTESWIPFLISISMNGREHLHSPTSSADALPAAQHRWMQQLNLDYPLRINTRIAEMVAIQHCSSSGKSYLKKYTK